MKLAPSLRALRPIPALLALSGFALAQDKPVVPEPEVKHGDPPKIDPAAKLVEIPDNQEFRKQFRIGLQLPETYSLDDQLQTYRKEFVETQRPFPEIGRPLFTVGAQAEHFNLPNILGDKNPSMFHLMFYGDARTAFGVSDNGANETVRLATRVNLDIDMQLTATERIHALIKPLEANNITNADLTEEFGGDDGLDDELNLDFEPDTLFFEGDVGPIVQGISGTHNNLDLPFAVGKIPLLLQNGVWLEDAFVGAAATIPAINSPKFDISNMDVTFFAGFDDVSSGAMKNADDPINTEGGNKLLGAATFIETRGGYAEVDYGVIVNGGDGTDASSHNISAAWTRRYWDFVSNSLRVIFNFGQNTEAGALFLLENSFRTRQPYTLLPYCNFFLGLGQPESLARDAGAGGVLKNTGINFEADALTLFPRLDDTGEDRIGAALGIEYLPNLFTAKHRQQIVLEVAGLHSNDDDAGDLGDQVGLGARYQIAIATSWIFRADVMGAYVEDGQDISGIRFEIRKKW